MMCILLHHCRLHRWDSRRQVQEVQQRPQGTRRLYLLKVRFADFEDKDVVFDILCLDKGGTSLFGMTAEEFFLKDNKTRDAMIEEKLYCMFVVNGTATFNPAIMDVSLFVHEFIPIAVNERTLNACRALTSAFDEAGASSQSVAQANQPTPG